MFDLYLSSPVWPILVAPFVGSFLGVLIVRLPAGAPVFLARSACPACGTTLSPAELMPLASFLILRGRCRHCAKPISLFHPAVELAAVAVALWAVLVNQGSVPIWVDCGLGWTLLTLAWIDWTVFLLPDVLTLSLLLAGLIATFVWFPDELTDHCVAAIFGYLSFQGLGLAYRWLRGRDGLGGGDAKLIAVAGAWSGFISLPLVVLGSAVIGLIAAGGMALAGRTVSATTRIPFGPCIALVFWITWLHRPFADNLIQLLVRL